MDEHEYHIRVNDDGTVDVLRNKRAWRYDLDDEDEALRAIKRAAGKGQPVTVIEADGYRRKITT